VIRSSLFVLLVLAAGCSRQSSLNYSHCLKLRVGMTKDQLISVMGAPEETLPFVPGKSLDYLKGRTAYEWSNPASMPSADHVSVDDASGKIESIRCAGADITAPYVLETPLRSTGTAVSASTGAPASPPAAPVLGLADAVAAYRKKEFVTAMQILGPLTQAGDSNAEFLAGLVFLNGAQPGREKDGAMASLPWLYKASRQKNAEAQAVYAFASMGNGTPAETVVEEIKLAAELGAPAGQLLLADVELQGLYPNLIPRNVQDGERLLGLAAKGGSPTAQLELAHRVQASAKDLVEAYRWALVASRAPLVDKLQDPLHSLTKGWTPEQRADAKKLLDELGKAITPAQIEEAKRRAGQ
jgi:TPR repeat protein